METHCFVDARLFYLCVGLRAERLALDAFFVLQSNATPILDSPPAARAYSDIYSITVRDIVPG